MERLHSLKRDDGAACEAPLEELISLSQLKALKTCFDRNPAGLSLDALADALRPLLPPAVTDATLREWLSRTKLADGQTISWDGFSSFFVQQNHQRVVHEDHRFEYQKAQDVVQGSEHVHRDMITCTLVHPNTGKVYTCGRDGIVKQWNHQTMQHERILHNAGTWITAAAFLRQGTRLLVSSVDRQLNLFDVGTGNLLCTYAGRKHASEKKEVLRRKHLSSTSKFGVKIDFPRQPQTSVDGSTSLDQFTALVSKAMAGQDHSPLEVSVTPLCELYSSPMAHCCLEGGRDHVALGLADGYLQTYPLEANADGKCEPVCRYPLHTNTISRLQYSSYLSGVFSCSWDGSLKVFNVEKQQVTQTFQTAGAANPKAVFTFDWSDDLQILASCGSERRVYLWNPYLSQPVFKLDAHQQPLVSVVLAAEQNQLVTLSLDKCIKVWDVRTFRCLQTVTDSTSYHPENSIGSMCFDSKRNRIITSTTFPTCWPLSRVSPHFPASYCGHNAPILQLHAFSDERQPMVVSTDRQEISTWHLTHGKKQAQFKTARQLPQAHQKLGTAVARTAVDSRDHRLITATEKGSLVIWSLQNCQVCSVGENPGDAAECTALLQCRRKDSWYVVAALGPRLVIFEDVFDSPTMKLSSQFNTASLSTTGTSASSPSITAVALCNPSVFALGLDDGRVVLYNPDVNLKCGELGRAHDSPVDFLESLSTLLLLSAQADGTVTVYNVVSRSMTHHFNSLPERDSTLYSVAMNCDFLFVGDSEGAVHVWQLPLALDPSGDGHRVLSDDELPLKKRALDVASAAYEQDEECSNAAGSPAAPPPPAAPAPPPPPQGSSARLQAHLFASFQANSEFVTSIAYSEVRSGTRRKSSLSSSAAAAALFSPAPPAAAGPANPRVPRGGSTAGRAAAPRAVLEYDSPGPSERFLITGGLDCQVKVFTLLGEHVGTFGLGKEWRVANRDTWAHTSTARVQKPAMSGASSAFMVALCANVAEAGRSRGRRASQGHATAPGDDEHDNPGASAFTLSAGTRSNLLFSESELAGGWAAADATHSDLGVLPSARSRLDASRSANAAVPYDNSLIVASGPRGVSPGRHIQRKGRNSTLVKRRRIRAFCLVPAALVVAAAAAVQRRGSRAPDLPGLRIPELALPPRGPAFMTEVQPGALVSSSAVTSPMADCDGTPRQFPETARVVQENMRLRVEQRLARHGMALTARNEADDQFQWHVSKGADIVRQIRSRKAAGAQHAHGKLYHPVGPRRAALRDIPKPKTPHPPPNWKPANCHLCSMEKSSRKGNKAAAASNAYMASYSVHACGILPDDDADS